MILLTPQFAENFDSGEGQRISAVEKSDRDCCFDVSFNDDCVKLYNEEYVEVFSPTVFETVEVYTSSSSDHSDNTDFTGSSTGVLSSLETTGNNNNAESINFDSIDAVTTIENLEPGTYTLDVLQPGDFNFDTVFVDHTSATPATDVTTCEKNQKQVENEDEASVDCVKITTAAAKKSKVKEDDGVKKLYKIRNNSKNSSRKPSSPRYSPRNFSAREFLHSFSNDLRKTEETGITSSVNEDEGKSLSWLLDFKISSIFHPVEDEPDNLEKVKRKSNNSQKKPRYTYTELIEQALKENGELTVSGIYNWISNHYPYYQQHDDRWKNSVRHNLSINPQFRKGKKASQGAGHFWNISETVSQNSDLNCGSLKINLLPRLNIDLSHGEKEPCRTIPDSVTHLINQIDEEVLAATNSIQECENINFTDVSLNDAAEQHLPHIDKHPQSSYINTTINDIEQLWESTNDNSVHRFSSFSPLIGEITEESVDMDEENFLIEDIHNSICLGDELFSSGINSPYYGLTTI